MTERKAYCYKLNPTKEQQENLVSFAGASRFVWNFMHDKCEYEYSKLGVFPGEFEQIRELTQIKRHESFSWLKLAPASILQESIRELHRSYRRYFQGKKRGDSHSPKPGKKRKKHLRQSFTYPKDVKINENKVYLPKIGWVKIYGDMRSMGTIKRVTVRNSVSGWYISILTACDGNGELSSIPEKGSVDVVISSDAVTLSTGEVYPVPKRLFTKIGRLGTMKDAQANKDKNSRRYRKNKKRILLGHERVKNIRTNYFHQLSSHLMQFSTVRVTYSDDFDESNHVGWGELFRQLDYKSSWHSCSLEYVNTNLHTFHRGTLVLEESIPI